MPGSVVGSVAGSVAGPVLGAVVGSISGNKAAKTQAAAAERAAEVQREMYEQTREDLAPYRASGVPANKRLAYLMGLDSAAFDRDAVREQMRTRYFGDADASAADGPDGPSGPGAPMAGAPNGQYSMPTSYMNTFVPQKIHPQFLKPQQMGAQDGR